MATFSEAEISEIAKVIGTSSQIAAIRLTFCASEITEADKTNVLSLLSRWATVSLNFTAIEPNERNYGVKINPTNEKNDIRKSIANLLQMSDLLTNGTGQIQLIRG